ncbi:uncharacterized protein F5147DRAFT_766668 [Suillus discolor]|uniref:Uncharacterized protein n=1 Tax=Suillus discolor TaxID=1912936 RepID=A0A9P7FL92_9AGAM|nr:uncharacterized protein F5147DRAFT_766668 [Suillus discolor]KAG2120775.1 hypothetical protein F5147DRAFT_766668 [Suillus discolor]
MNGTNYWNLYANYFKEHMQTELVCIGREAPAGGGMPSATLKSASAKSGFEAAIVLCGKVVNEDGSLSHSYNMPGAAGIQFWKTQCHASDDAIIGHLKAHVYNTTSLAESQAPEEWNDGLKWVKLKLIKQVAQLGGKCAWDKNFPWKGMSSVLADANLCIKGYPANRCLLPSEAHNENSKNKGIGALTQKEIVVLMEALKSGTMQASIMASERPIITGIVLPSDWSHTAHIKPSNAATKVKKANKVTKVPPPPDTNDDDNSDDDDSIVSTACKFRKPTMRL